MTPFCVPNVASSNPLESSEGTFNRLPYGATKFEVLDLRHHFILSEKGKRVVVDWLANDS